MRTLTAAQLGALTAAFPPEPVVHAWKAHAPNTTRVQLPLIGGSITYDASSQDRTTCELTLPAVDTDGTRWLPETWGSLLVPDDAVLAVSFGVGVGPRIPVARLWLDDVTVSRPDGLVTLRGVSRASRVAQAGFPTGDRRYVGSTVDVVTRIVRDALGDPTVPVVIRGGVVGVSVPAGTTFAGDPWQAVEDLCDAAGIEAWFDELDQLVIGPTPQVLGVPALTFGTGEGGTVTEYDVSLTRAPNVVRLAFQNPSTDADVQGTATATGPAAPSGPYGPYRTDETRTGAVTPAQANAAAGEWLTRAGGLLRNVTLRAAPHPGVECGDTIGVRLVTGVSERHRVVRVVLPLTPGDAMTLETRATPW